MIKRFSNEEGEVSYFDEVNKAISKRMSFFETYRIHNEANFSKGEIKTISNILFPLAHYELRESPLNPALAKFYELQNNGQTFFTIPPESEGQISVNAEEKPFKPSFKWLSRTLLDSTRLSVDEVEGKKIKKDFMTEKWIIPEDWRGVKELLIFNVRNEIHLEKNIDELENIVEEIFKKLFWVRIKKLKFVYYKGKPSIVIKFLETHGAIFAHYSLTESFSLKRKLLLGQNSEVFRISNNRTKVKEKDGWIAIIFRKLPKQMTKDMLLSILKKRDVLPLWIEEPVEIENYKYTICTMSCLIEALKFCSVFQVNSPIRKVKVNLHPRSRKIWKKQTSILD